MPNINVNKLSEILNTKADIDLNNTGVFSTNGGVVNLVQSTPSDAKEKEVASADFSLKQGGLELMDIVFAPLGIDESKNKRRYLNGQLIIQEQFPAFTAAVKARMTTMANAFTTEENWQAEKTNSKLGQCGKFVVDDTAGTIRLPCVVNAQGLADLASIDGIKNESLPNIKGKTIVGLSEAESAYLTPPFYYDKTTLSQAIGTHNTNYNVFGFDASLSSSTYQDNAPVQQEAVQYPYCIQVATGVEETLPAIREYKVNNSDYFGKSMYSDVAPDNASWLASNGTYNARAVYPDYYDWLNGKIGQVITANGGKVVLSTDTITDYDFVINQNDQTFRLPLLNGERVLVAKKEATAEDLTWYNLYSDGWLEQGGQTASIAASSYTTTTFLKEFSRIDYSIQITSVGAYTGKAEANSCVTAQTTSNFTLTSGSYATSPYYWQACGYAEIPAQSEFTEVTGLYYYVGDTVQDASLINAGAVLGQLSDKADVSLGNVNSAAIDKMALVGSPSVNYTSLTLGASGSKYTAPANGWFVIKVDANGNRAFVQMECGGMVSFNQNYGNEQDISCSLQVAKGQEMTLQYAGIIAPNNLSSFIFRFVNSRSN